MTKAKNQIRILCDNCGCYYFWDIEFEFKDYNKVVYQTPKKAGRCCPECGSQEVAADAHHSAGIFNCEMGYTGRSPRYLSGPGCSFEPLLADKFEEQDEHKARHKLLHKHLSELVNDYKRHNNFKLLSKITARELWNWSHEQTLKPMED